MTQRFAYGQNEFQSCECPLVAAGLPPDGYHHRKSIAREFDHEVWRLLANKNGIDSPSDVGTVSEELAKQAWQTVIEDLAEHNKPKKLRIAKQARQQLGWNDA